MKFVYFGSSTFSKKTLEELITKGITPEVIVTKPDKPSGRGLKLTPTEVSIFADTKNISCIKPKSLLGKDIEQRLQRIDADFFIVADYGEIIPDSILSLPKVFPICVHPSLLPLYRGATPIEQAMIDGRNKTGVTIFKIVKEIDAGEIIAQVSVPITEEISFACLRDVLVKAGADLLEESVERIENKKCKLMKQDISKASFTHKLKKQDGKIDWSKKAIEIYNLVRACLEWPTTYTYYGESMLKVIEVEIVSRTSAEIPGEVISIDKSGICIATSENVIKLKRLKLQGKREMDAFSFACGQRIKAGERFG